MKKLFALVLVFLLLPTICAIEFNMDEEFAQGQTLMARVSGNFLNPIQKSDVAFYKGHVQIALDYDIKKIDSDYYIYALLSEKDEGNYSIVLEDARYMQGSSTIEEDIVKNFTITNQTADFSINPGFAVENQFSISVQNLQDYEITIEVKTKENLNSTGQTYTDSVTLKSGQIKEIDFEFYPSSTEFQFVELNTDDLTYNIPSYVPAYEFTEEIFKFYPEEIIVSAPTNEETTRTIYIYNTGDEAVENVVISVSNLLETYVNLSQTTINKIDANSNVPLELTFFSTDELEFDGHIKAELGLEIIYSQITLKFIENYSVVEVPVTNSEKTCAELGYPICSSSEKCSSGEVVTAKDDVCCIGTCETKKKSSAGLIIGIVILLAVAVFLFWFFKKYKKTKKPFNLLKHATKKP